MPYDTAYLSGFVVEHYQVVLIDAAQAARESMDGSCVHLCGRQVPGDTYRSLQVQADYGDETFKHILVPVWLLAYQYGHEDLPAPRQRLHRRDSPASTRRARGRSRFSSSPRSS